MKCQNVTPKGLVTQCLTLKEHEPLKRINDEFHNDFCEKEDVKEMIIIPQVHDASKQHQRLMKNEKSAKTKTSGEIA